MRCNKFGISYSTTPAGFLEIERLAKIHGGDFWYEDEILNLVDRKDATQIRIEFQKEEDLMRFSGEVGQICL